MQAAQLPLRIPAPGNQGWPQPGAETVSEDIAAARRQKIQDQFASITFIPDRPAAAVLQALSKLHYSQFPVDPGLDKNQVKWIVVEPARSPLTSDTVKERRIFCVRRKDNTLEALMPVKDVLKNPNMKTGRFAYKVIFSPADPLGVQLKPSFVLTSLYPASPSDESDKARIELLDHEVNLRLHLNNLATHFPRLENWGFKPGHHQFTIDAKNQIKERRLCQKMMMEDECLELNLLQFFEKYPDLSEKTVLDIMIRVLEALEKLYQGGRLIGFMHCDIKRENVILKYVEGKWIAYLTDVGLATPLGMQASKWLKGTPKDWPPEYWKFYLSKIAQIEYLASFDLWQCGILAWELLNKVHTEKQWPEFKKAQYNVGRVKGPYFLCDTCHSTFSRLFPPVRYENDRAKNEHEKFLKWLSAGKGYTQFSKEALTAYLIEKWEEELINFQTSIAVKHPHMKWLQSLLRLDPAERPSIQQILQQIKESHAAMPDTAPAPAVLTPPQPLPLPPTPPQNTVQKTEEAAQEAHEHALLTTDIHTQIIAKELSKSNPGWWGWIYGWGKGDKCSLQ